MGYGGLEVMNEYRQFAENRNILRKGTKGWENPKADQPYWNKSRQKHIYQVSRRKRITGIYWRKIIAVA